MRGSQIVLLAVFGAAVCTALRGEEPRKRNAKLEFLEVENGNASPIEIWFKSVRDESPADAKDWQPSFTVPANYARRVPLYGYEPFEIEIQADAETAYRLESVPLCAQMAECATAPEFRWKAKGMRRKPDGQWGWDQSMDTELQLKVDTKKVRVRFQLVGKKLDEPIPPPPPRPKPR